MGIKHLNGIRSSYIETNRIKTYLLTAGDPENTPVVFLHGNASASTIWEEMMLELSSDYFCIAPDLRGYGQSDPNQIIDATRGMMEWVDDLIALVEEMDLNPFYLVGHSLGGSVCWGAIPEIGQKILSVTLMAPGPPAGFGGIHGNIGEPNNPDFSGSGAGVVNEIFAENLRKGLRDTDDKIFSPRTVMHRLFWRDGFEPGREEEILTALLQIHCGQKRYPGDYDTSEYWPGVAPGKFGPVNALSPKYNSEVVNRLTDSRVKPPILWIHGDKDQIISNESLSDPGYQGKAGFRNGWPGDDKFPPQPMEDQIRHALDQYEKNSGHAEELVVSNAGHTPFLEQPEEVYKTLRDFLNRYN
ncbi:alpha/beta fold hydrolase [Rhodohalobacter sp. 8-1]|uniref:alpha/beta fold hydrolase n=1 Tax=Rhodohalobacter sp. 8-1 TaxID=3131972 RepID=UPI0030ECE5C5